jgi:hypothetical protein
VYYAFERDGNIGALRYDRRHPLFWSLDFNINPMCSVIGQRVGDEVRILAELVLPDSNTWAACEEFLARTAEWTSRATVPLRVYGDATGDGRQSSASRTDWQIVREFFGRYFDRYTASFQVPTSNPPVKDRVNCVNAVLGNQAGERRLIMAHSCKQLIQDFERVHWKADPSGNALAAMDKTDPQRMHVSDAVGYMIAHEFGMRQNGGPRSTRMI